MSRYLIIVVLAMFVAIPRICAQSRVRMALPKTQSMVHNSLSESRETKAKGEMLNLLSPKTCLLRCLDFVEFQYQMTLPVWLYPLIPVQPKET